MSLTTLSDLDISSIGQEALAELLPTAIKRAVEAIPHEIYDMSLDKLEKTIKSRDGHESMPIDLCRARIAFWLEFERHYRTGKAFELSAVYGGLMTASRFQKDVLGNSYWTAYLITPPTSYAVATEELLYFGLQFQREVLAIPHGKGKDTNLKLVALKNQIVEGIHDRLKGKAITRNANVNVNTTSASGSPAPKSIKDIDQQIKELEATTIDINKNEPIGEE